MRPALICALLTVCLVFLLAATVSSPLPAGLTVILDFRGAHSDPSIKEMERESSTIMKTTGVHLDWKLRNQAAADTYPDLVVMTFKGSCRFDPTARIYDELGPLGSTKTTDNEIQPFGQVDCDHVVRSARSAMFGGDYSRGDFLVGRALGRVVAHELVHMLTHSADHGQEGVFESALSGQQLISPSLPLAALDVDRLKSLH
jgi:hypothetical protein